MLAPAIPSNERERLLALHRLQLLDTSSEERFDRLTRIAKRIFNVPIVLISLIDEDRQWFKSKQGIDVCETPRAISFCGHAILNNEIMVVEDAVNDPRFADNPAVIDAPYVRFYAGCPIRTYDGYKLGTLCLADNKPRQFSDEDQVLLRDLANLVEHEIESNHMAFTDELTQITNRRGFFFLANYAVDYCHRQQKSLTVCMFDLNHFKAINDDFGHAAGDEALNHFAHILKNHLRKTDISARLSGDEFAAVLTDIAPQHVDALLAQFVDTLGEFRQNYQLPYQLSAAYGYCSFNPSASTMTLHEALEIADAHMYEHKQRHRPQN